MVLIALSWHPSITDSSYSIPHPAAPSTATLDTIWVEDSFLMRHSTAYFDPTDFKMRKFTQLSNGPHFHIIYKFSVALLDIQVHLEAPM